MARWIKADGTEETVKPKGVKWTLEELQAYVSGYIQLVPGFHRVVCDEEGRLKNKPFNTRASMLFGMTLVGDILVLDPGEKM